MSTLPNDELFRIAESDLTPSVSFSKVPGLKVQKLEAGPELMPYTIRTGEISCGNPLERKSFRYISFFGNGTGTVRVRVYIDKRYVCDSQIILEELPNNNRRVNLPVRRSSGYVIDVEIATVGNLRGMEITYDPEVSP